MKEIGPNLSFTEISAVVIFGLLLIAVLILLLGVDAVSGEEKENREEFVKKLKEKEKKLNEKEDKLKKIEEQLRSTN